MAITIGNSSIRDIYLGNSKVDSVFLGDVLVYSNLANDPEDTYNQFVFDTSICYGTRTITLQNYRAGDTTHWNGYTDWGDGTINKELSHAYPEDGIYTIKTKYMINDSEGNKDYNFPLIECKSINKNIKDLSYLFYGCDKLTSVNLSNLNKSLYYKAAYAFCNCESLSIDLSGFKFTGDVSNMFGYNGPLSINLSGADFTRVKNISNMLDSNVHTTDVMLYGCSDDNITKIVPAIREKIFDGTYMTWNGTIYIDEFKDTYPAPNYGWSYKYRIKHIETELDNTYNYFVFNTHGITLSTQRAGDTTYWDGLTDWGDNIVDTRTEHTYDYSGTYTVKTKYVLNKVFDNGSGCQILSGSNLIRCDGINKGITNGSYLFSGCSNLESVNLSNIINYGYLSKSYNMFSGCNSLKSIDFSGIDTSGITNMSLMFNFCESLTELDLSSFDTSNVTNMEAMFSVCSSLTKLNISNFNMDNVTKYSNMFIRCDNLTLDNIIMTNCNQATKDKITKMFA